MPRHLVSEQLHQHSQYYVCVDSQSYGYLTCGVGCPFWGMVMGKRTTKPKNSMSQPRHVIVLSWSAT